MVTINSSDLNQADLFGKPASAIDLPIALVNNLDFMVIGLFHCKWRQWSQTYKVVIRIEGT